MGIDRAVSTTVLEVKAMALHAAVAVGARNRGTATILQAMGIILCAKLACHMHQNERFVFRNC